MAADKPGKSNARVRARRAVCSLEQLAPGSKIRIEIGSRAVLVCRTEEGAVFAVSDDCPHQGASLAAGSLAGTTVSTAPETYEYGRRGEVIRCPWHQYEFDVTSGESLFGERRNRLKCYEISVENGHVFVHV